MARSRQQPLPPIGKLEMAILEHLWNRGESDVAAAHSSVGKPRGITANTVGSTLERLHRKGLTRRRKVSHAYIYETRISRDQFRARRLADAGGGLRALKRKGLLSAFVNLIAETDETALAELERLIAEKRAEGPD